MTRRPDSGDDGDLRTIGPVSSDESTVAASQPDAKPAETYDALLRAIAAPPAIEPNAVALALALTPGAVVDGTYEVIEALGVGGMGLVFRARDRDLQRDVALKVHKAEGGPRETERLLGEARALAKVSHPNVLAVHGVGRVGESIFVALEYVEGLDARQWLDPQTHRWPEILDVYRQASAGLAAIHEAGLVHRDFKPDNVLVGTDGRVRVADFGLARAPRIVREATEQDETLSGNRSTSRTEGGAGTPAYAAPEQWGGGRLDARADQFSFCVSLFEALYGTRPFVADTVPELIYRITTEPPLPAPSGSPVPRWLDRALRRGLAPDPSKRFADINELGAALDPARVRFRRRATTAALFAGVVGTAGLVYGTLDDPCGAVADPMVASWSAENRQRVAKAFTESELGGATAAWERAAVDLDAFARRWREERVAACVDSNVDVSPETATHSARCFADGHEHFDALVERLGTVDEYAIRRVLHWVHALPSPEHCREEQALLAAPPVPRDPELRDAVAALEADLRAAARHRKFFVAGADPAAVEELITQARALGHAPILADALHEQGNRYEATGAYDDAERCFRESFDAALQGAAPRRAAQAALRLGTMARLIRQKPADAEPWLRTGLALAERLVPDQVRVELLNDLACAVEEQGRFDEARALVERGLTLQRELDPRSPFLPGLLVTGSVIERHAGNHAEFQRRVEEVVEVTLDLLGPDDPGMGFALSNRAAARAEAGNYEGALADLDAVDRIDERIGLTNFAKLQLLERKTVIFLQSDGASVALPFARQLVDLADATLEPENPRRSDFRNLLMVCLRGAGELEDAWQVGEKLLATGTGDRIGLLSTMALLAESRQEPTLALDYARQCADATREHNDDRLSQALGILAEMELGTGNREAALRTFEESFAAWEPGVLDRAHWGFRFTYGKELTADPIRRLEGIANVMTAAAYYNERTPSDEHHRTRMLRWLAEQSWLRQPTDPRP